MPDTGWRALRRAALLACLFASAPALAILDGLPAERAPDVASSTVAIVIADLDKRDAEGRPGYYPSTGIVVAREWILTVKHSFAEHNGRQHVWQLHFAPEIRVGGDDQRIHLLERDRVIFHPSLDLALVRVDMPIPFQYRPARLVADGRQLSQGPGLSGLLAGYGPVGNTPGQNRLNFVEQPISALSLAQVRRRPALVPPDQIRDYLEIDQREGRGSCRGDSGGPVFARLAGGGLGLLGVIRGNASYDGAHPCLGYSYAVRVDRILPWLTQVTGRIYDPASMQLVEAVAGIGGR